MRFICPIYVQYIYIYISIYLQTNAFTFRITQRVSWHNPIVFHFLKRVLCGIVPLLLTSDLCLISQFPSPIQIRLFPSIAFLARSACSSENTALLFQKNLTSFSPRGWTLWYSNCFPLFSATSTSHPRFLSFSHHPLPGLCKKVGRNSACCLYPVLF